MWLRSEQLSSWFWSWAAPSWRKPKLILIPGICFNSALTRPFRARAPQSLYAYYYHNNPEFLRTNMALRMAVAPVYFYSELGFREVLPRTDFGIGIRGGAFGENYYEINQGDYLKGQSFDGSGAGASLNLYHLLDPGYLILQTAVEKCGEWRSKSEAPSGAKGTGFLCLGQAGDVRCELKVAGGRASSLQLAPSCGRSYVGLTSA